MPHRHSELAARFDRRFRAARVHHFRAGIKDDQTGTQRRQVEVEIRAFPQQCRTEITIGWRCRLLALVRHISRLRVFLVSSDHQLGKRPSCGAATGIVEQLHRAAHILDDFSRRVKAAHRQGEASFLIAAIGAMRALSPKMSCDTDSFNCLFNVQLQFLMPV
jgi:hypothetical protein